MSSAILVLLLAGCSSGGSDASGRTGKAPRTEHASGPASDTGATEGVDEDTADPSEEDTGTADPPPPNHAPTVGDARIIPAVFYADSTIRCYAEAHDEDGDIVRTDYRWTNLTTGTLIGVGDQITLDPYDILPNETLRCSVDIVDSHGARAYTETMESPACGYDDPASLEDVSLDVSIIFRPWATDELEPGFGGMPWDWDGDIPDEVFELGDLLSSILGFINTVAPDPRIASAEVAVDAALAVLDAIDTYAPVFMAARVPPDPDIYPYTIDDEGRAYPFWEDPIGIQWDDTYEVTLSASHVDLDLDPYLAFDIEDIDLLLDDNMGDWHEQGDTPLILTSELLLDSAYCPAVFYNPTDYAQSSALAHVPSSILWMEIFAY